MCCEDFAARLNELLDARVEPRDDAAIAAHADRCDSCRGLLAAYEAMLAGAAAFRAPTPRSRRGMRRRAAWALAATAACCTAVLISWKDHASPPTSSPAAAVAKSSLAPSRPLPSVVEITRRSGRAYVGLFQETARSVDEAFTTAAAVPSPRELVSPLVFADDGLWKSLHEEFAPAAGEAWTKLRALVPDPESVRL